MGTHAYISLRNFQSGHVFDPYKYADVCLTIHTYVVTTFCTTHTIPV